MSDAWIGVSRERVIGASDSMDMPADHVIEVEFLEDDLREIHALFDAAHPERDWMSALLPIGLERFQRDEALRETLRDLGDPAAESAKQELKRRETLALLISMRSRTIRNEIRTDELTARVHTLLAAYADRRQRADEVRRSIARLRRRVARLEEALEREASRPQTRAPSLAA